MDGGKHRVDHGDPPCVGHKLRLPGRQSVGDLVDEALHLVARRLAHGQGDPWVSDWELATKLQADRCLLVVAAIDGNGGALFIIGT